MDEDKSRELEDQLRQTQRRLGLFSMLFLVMFNNMIARIIGKMMELFKLWNTFGRILRFKHRIQFPDINILAKLMDD